MYLSILNFIYVQRIMYTGAVCGMHGLINYIETKAKCCHPKKIYLYMDFAAGVYRVHRLEIQSVMLVFSTQLCELLPL